ncbi:MAG: hypothetical protein HZA48_04010 [Planctomycetes bacterium]|nr:hypothetical protein [Planctomycetota bacterium]
MITAEEFSKIDLRIARVVSVSDHPNANKLYIMQIDIGGGNTKQVVAGLKQYMNPESLLNKLVVVVNNLEPATLRGVDSQAMLLAAEHDSAVILIVPEKDFPPGTRVH